MATKDIGFEIFMLLWRWGRRFKILCCCCGIVFICFVTCLIVKYISCDIYLSICVMSIIAIPGLIML